MALPAPSFSGGDEQLHLDFRKLRMKPNHAQKAFWVLPDNRIVLESSSPVYKQAEALLISIADPVSRTEYLQEYELKAYSLYAGASMGFTTAEILKEMEKFAKNELPPTVRELIHKETSRYGKVKLIIKGHQLFVECRNQPEVLEELLRDPELALYRPQLQLPRCHLRVNGRSKKTFSGAFRFLPNEFVASLDAYRRIELRYAQITGLRVVHREAGGAPVAGFARSELRFRLDFGGSEEELKRFHNTLALGSTAQPFDPANPPYDPSNADHEMCLGFASEMDRLRFGQKVLAELRAQAGRPAASEEGALNAWAEEAAAAPDLPATDLPATITAAAAEAPSAGGLAGADPQDPRGGTMGGTVGAAFDPTGGASAGGPSWEAALLEAEDDALRRRAEGGDDDEGALGMPAAIEDFEVDPSKVKEVKARCRALKWPLLEEYDFRNDTLNPELPIELKHTEKASIRDYQTQALSRVFNNHRARSGIVVLPCGSGKTLVGITAACTVKRSTLVLCNSSVSVEQWYQQFRMWAQIDPNRISRFTANSKEPLHKEACVLISTYAMIGYTGKRAADTRALMADVSDREWGLVILDEVHVASADTFLTCMTTRTRSRCKLGLSATLVREDEGIAVLEEQIGPKLFEANWLDLQKRGFIANVSCAEVWCQMTPEFYREYVRADAANQGNMTRLLTSMNPNKFRCCEYLMRYHENRGDKIIIFSDVVYSLREYAQRLKRPAIDGKVPQNERMKILGDFKAGGGYSTVLISKVGDTSIDLPEANVIIQIASHYGARRQEAQRLGRILRPKARTGTAFNAFFYTLVSRDTKEMYYSGKRQQFLVDQGYSFRVLTELPGMADLSGLYEADVPPNERIPLAFGSHNERLNLLTAVLSNDEAAMRDAEDAEDDEERRATGGEQHSQAGGAAGAVKRRAANIGALSGAGSDVYHEVTVRSDGQQKLLNQLKKARAGR